MAAFPIVVEDPKAEDNIFQRYYHWFINEGRDQVVRGTPGLVRGIVTFSGFTLFFSIFTHNYSSMTVHCWNNACISRGFHSTYSSRLCITKCLTSTYPFSYQHISFIMYINWQLQQLFFSLLLLLLPDNLYHFLKLSQTKCL